VAETLQSLHFFVRYLVLVAGLGALVLSAAGLGAGRVSAPAAGAFRAFVLALDVQVLLGLVYLTAFPFYPALSGHIVMMLAALAVAHVTAVRLRRLPADQRSPRTMLLATVGCLVLIAGGILSIGRSVV
jgi:hypothetical protein